MGIMKLLILIIHSDRAFLWTLLQRYRHYAHRFGMIERLEDESTASSLTKVYEKIKA